MDDIKRSLKKPFTNIGYWILASLFSIIPVINFFSNGYLKTIIKSSFEQQTNLPHWNWSEQFKDGFFMFLISLAWLSPFITFFILGLVMEYVPLILLGLLIGVITMYILPAAICEYAYSDKFSNSFILSRIFRKAFNSRYFGRFLLGFVLMIPYVVVGSLLFEIESSSIVINIIISSPFYFAATIVFYSFLAEKYIFL